jgi:polysaccharide pyruvyl transferase WcaK-like protein
MGDVAMLQVAVRRVAAAIPEASLQVFTEDPVALSRHCPEVRPISHWAREMWLEEWRLWGRLHRIIPRALWGDIEEGQRRCRRRWPQVYHRALSFRLALSLTGRRLLDDFLSALSHADLLVFCGQGTLADEARRQAMNLLGTAELALARGIPVVMFGQGVGPLTDRELRCRATAVLPASRLIALREARRGIPLLESIGVLGDRIVTTGDDAVELAYAQRPDRLGHAIGIHVRKAPLAITDERLIEQMRPVLAEFLTTHGAPLVPLPISHNIAGSYDPGAIRQLVQGLDGFSDGGEELDTPMKVIKAAGQCRIVVTGAYHAAVFALAQGVSVVCLGRTRYYLDKFEGLRDQFGPACWVVGLEDPEMPAQLRAAIRDAWAGAGMMRESLLNVAARQVQASRAAYDRLPAILSSHPRPRAATTTAPRVAPATVTAPRRWQSTAAEWDPL